MKVHQYPVFKLAKIEIIFPHTLPSRPTGSHKKGSPPPCSSGRIGIYEDPNIVLIIPYSYYYKVGGLPKVSINTFPLNRETQTLHPEQSKAHFVGRRRLKPWLSQRNPCLPGHCASANGI